MKTVLRNSSECAHVFAQQTQNHGRAGNVSFDYDTFFSYSAPIAQIVDMKKRRVLITSRSYSVTTGGHTSMVSSALSHFDIIHVPSIGAFYSQHKDNVKHFVQQYNDAVASGKRSLKLNTYQDARTALESAKKYVSWFPGCKKTLPAESVNFANRNFHHIDKLIQEKDAEISAREARLSSPIQEAIREKARVKREQARQRALQDAVTEWRKHNPYVSAYKLCDLDNALLRLNTDKTRIETSKGAQVLVEHAVKIWPVIERSHREKASYPGNGFKIDYYTVTSITNGNLIIGCHNIVYSEMESIAKQLNL